MTISIVYSAPKLILPGVTPRDRIPNVVVVCDYFGCEKALNFERQGDTAGIIRHIINDNPHGWTCERSKFHCGQHSQRADKKKLRGQIRD